MRALNRRGLLMAAAAAIAASAASSCGPGDARVDACSSDRDCRSGRLCIDNRCDAQPGAPAADAGAGAGGAVTAVWYVSESVNRDVDILFMIDNSLGMTPLQEKLIVNFPAFTQVLQGLPLGPPDLHIGVVSSSMGAGVFTPGTCPTGGDQGILQAQARGVCTQSGLDDGQRFISNVGGQANYTGKIEDVFACIAALGDGGCGFEAQLGSVVRALGADGDAPPPENAGFLRPDALLAIVLLTDEDDCSAPPDSTLFDPSSRLVSDPLGPLESYRCNEYGILCYGLPSPRTMAASFPPGACVPAEGAGLLKPVAETVAQIKGLKADPKRTLVSVIAGPPDPYVVQLVAPLIATDPHLWPQVAPSCGDPLGSPADPGVRLAAFASAFGDRGLDTTACAPSLAPALQTIADGIGQALAPTCIDGVLADADPGTPGLQPDCQVADLATNGHGGHTLTALPSCAASGGAPPCWTLDFGTPAACPGQHILSITRDGPPPPEMLARAACTICPAGATDPRCGF